MDVKQRILWIKKNNPAPENDSGDKGQEDKPTTFTQEQVNYIVSKRREKHTKRWRNTATSQRNTSHTLSGNIISLSLSGVGKLN